MADKSIFERLKEILSTPLPGTTPDEPTEAPSDAEQPQDQAPVYFPPLDDEVDGAPMPPDDGSRYDPWDTGDDVFDGDDDIDLDDYNEDFDERDIHSIREQFRERMKEEREKLRERHKDMRQAFRREVERRREALKRRIERERESFNREAEQRREQFRREMKEERRRRGQRS